MDLHSGLLMGFLGCTITFVGFFIAYLVAARNYRKTNKKKNRVFTTVEQSLRSLNAKWGDTE